MAICATELYCCLQEARGAPPKCHRARLPALRVPRVIPADLVYRSYAICRAQGLFERRRHSQACHSQGLFQPLAPVGGSPGVGVVEFFGQVLGVAIRATHAPLHQACTLVGQVALCVSDLVELTPGDDWVVEGCLHRAGKRLGAFEHAQDSPGDVDPPVSEPHEQTRQKLRVFRVAFDEGQRVLQFDDVDGNYVLVTSEVQTVDHKAGEIDQREVRRYGLGQRGLSCSDETPGERRARRSAATGLDGRYDWLEAGTIATDAVPGEHLLHRHAPEQLGRGEAVVGGKRHLARAIHAAHPGPGDLRRTASEGDNPVLSAVAQRHAVRTMMTLWAHRDLHLMLQHRIHDLQPATDDEGQQALFEFTGELTHGNAHDIGERKRCLLNGSARVPFRLLRRRAPSSPNAPDLGVIVPHVDVPLPVRMS